METVERRKKFCKQLSHTSTFLFDLDGTLVDLEKLNFSLLSKVIFKDTHLKLTNADYQKYISGRGSLTGIRSYLGSKRLSTKSASSLHHEFRKQKMRELELYFDRHVTLRKGARNLLNILQHQKRNMAITTSTGKVFSDIILNRLGLISYFDLILDREDVKRIKPDPEIYLKALKGFKISSTDAIVFEDSINGIQASQEAGIFCIGMDNPGQNEAFISMTDFVIRDFDDVVPLLLELLEHKPAFH